MEKILILLDERNRYLTKFLLLTEGEADKFAQGNFSGIDRFYEQRESFLEMVHQIEKLIDTHLQNNSDKNIQASLKRSVEVTLRLRDELIQRILAKDLDMLGLIETAKSKIIRELQTVGRGKKVVGAYHSGLPALKTVDEKV